jgi:HPt (histidine-containing phosphotransfer) domain-containing protein
VHCVNEIDDVLDLGRLKEAFGEDDRVGIADLLRRARETESGYLRALREGIAQADIRAVARAAHSIKGSASNIGANRFSRVAADIEDRARLEQWDGIAGLADDLERCFAELTARITEYGATAV